VDAIKLENNHQHRKDKPTPASTSSNFDPEQIKRSSEFWNSRGNIGEKINILTGLNLVIVRLITALAQIIGESNAIPETLRDELLLVEKYTHQLLVQPVSGLELLEKLESLEIDLKKINETVSEETTEAYAPVDVDTPSNRSEFGVFVRNPKTIDKWGMVESIKSLIKSYSALSHLGFPNYYLAACEDLLNYKIQPQYSRPHDSEILQIPASHLRTIISKLLREAPSARLLQNLKKMFPNTQEAEITPLDLEQIHSIISRYYESISQFLTQERSLQDSQRASRVLLQNFNLGAGDLESRIPNVSFNVVKDIYTEIERTSGNDFRQYVLSETLVLINRLNDSILNNKRYVELLRRLK
jgi:hypothetical protein